MSKEDKRIKLQSRLATLIGEIGYSLYELAGELKQNNNLDLEDDLLVATAHLAILTDKLEEKQYDFSRNIEIWLENKEEWNEAAWNYIKSQDN